MTTYAPVPAFVDQRRHPRTLFLILAAHAAVIAAVMMAKGYVPVPALDPPTIVDLIKEPLPPPENPPPPQPDQRSTVDQPSRIIPTPLPNIQARPMLKIYRRTTGPPIAIMPTPPPSGESTAAAMMMSRMA